MLFPHLQFPALNRIMQSLIAEIILQLFFNYFTVVTETWPCGMEFFINAPHSSLRHFDLQEEEGKKSAEWMSWEWVVRWWASELWELVSK